MRVRMGALLFVAMACLQAMQDAMAGDVRKCIGGDGHPAYVSGLCPTGTREAWVREVAPEPDSPKDTQRRQDELRRWQSRRHAGTGRHGQAGRRSASRSGGDKACEAAKHRRDEVRERDWYRMTFDTMSQLDAQVARACR